MKLVPALNEIKFILTLLLTLQVCILTAQQTDSLTTNYHLNGSVSVTHNGISFIPTFSLDKPAALFNFSVGNEKFTFEPEMRFALAGKPWSFIFWFRYKAIQNKKFSLRFGAHPALNFRTIPVISNGISKDVLEARRFLTSEIVPTYSINDNFKIGLYYLYSMGFDDSQRHGHFLVFNTSFPQIRLPLDFNFGLFPSVFYLQLDNLHGYYFSSTFKLSNSNTPFSLESIISKIIKSEIAPDRDFVWNISLVYAFNNKFSKSDKIKY